MKFQRALYLTLVGYACVTIPVGLIGLVVGILLPSHLDINSSMANDYDNHPIFAASWVPLVSGIIVAIIVAVWTTEDDFTVPKSFKEMKDDRERRQHQVVRGTAEYREFLDWQNREQRRELG